MVIVEICRCPTMSLDNLCYSESIVEIVTEFWLLAVSGIAESLIYDKNLAMSISLLRGAFFPAVIYKSGFV